MGKQATIQRNPRRAAPAPRPPRINTRSAQAEACASPSEDPTNVADFTHWLTVLGAKHNNLKNLTVEIPLGRFVCVTGVSGSGKSSLVNDILREALARDLNGATNISPGQYERIDGLEHLDKVIDIDQSPIGRTPRSNPATYVKVFDQIRDLYSRLPDAKVRGYKPGRFSFNVATDGKGGGRCEACQGNGSNRMEMELLADVWVTCPLCNGRRFSHETLQILYKGRSITEVLEMDVQEALAHFENVPAIALMLRTLHDVGLDYLKLGQSSTTLSGGEAQRIKLARELVKKSTGRALYILDEPTTGLHFADVKRLLAVLHGFVDSGNTVLVIEHNLDVVKTADWVIDLGPEGGDAGGKLVAAGTPEELAACEESHTGKALREVLDPENCRLPIANCRLEKNQGQTSIGNRKLAIGNSIRVIGARQHNLKDVSVDIPRGKMTVCCGPSGSGKSSFAIDTVYTEGQRRYVESLSSYARQFLGRLQPPKVDHVHGLSPAISIEQKNTSRSPRSTVGTVTEIYDYMRVLWTRIGKPHCPTCRIPVGTQTTDEIVERILALGEDEKVMLLAPLLPVGDETFPQLLSRERANGYLRARIDGVVHALDDGITLNDLRPHRVELVVDRVVVRRKHASRIADSVEQALTLGQGVILAAVSDGAASADQPDLRFARHCSCTRCGRDFDELTSHHFSFNTRMGWCEACEGLGTQQGASASAIVVHPTRSILDGAIRGWGEVRHESMLGRLVFALANYVGFDPHTPWNRLLDTQQLKILHGCGEEWIGWPNVEGRRAKGQDRRSGASALGELPTASFQSPIGNRPMAIRFQWRGFYPAIGRATRINPEYRTRLGGLVTEAPCEACAGGRLRPEPAAVRLGGATIHEICLKPLSRTLPWFTRLRLDPREKRIAGELLREITSRLRFLVDVGLDYLTVHRSAATLSGGEAQRIQLASQIGTGLTGVLYVLDEPTIGLHPRDNRRLIDALRRLRNLGNTLLLVEHDREVIDAADHVLDFGPGAGAFGGRITAAASPAAIRSKRNSLTGKYLSNREAIAVPSNRRPVDDRILRTDLDRSVADDVSAGSRKRNQKVGNQFGVANGQWRMNDRSFPFSIPHSTFNILHWLTIHGARENNLQEIDVAFPLGRFTCVTGVSGSGKSSLVHEILYKALANRLHRAGLSPGGHDRITGMDQVDKVINVDQAPIGLTPTSNPATYTGMFDAIREVFARLPLSKVRGYTANRFSFNRPGGRCEACEGMGQRCIEMHFLPDVWIDCESCGAARYVPETLEVQFRGRSIADVLTMRVHEALALFENVPKVRRILQTLDDVGLGYLALGQAAPTLSGGEAQRVKLAAELAKPSTGKTLYILDEPTTGLHFDDLRKLLDVLHRLVDLGNAVVCIEHNLDVIKTADWVIDLGPEAGDEGGRIVATGPPEAIAGAPESHTGKSLKPVLEIGPIRERPVYDAVKVARVAPHKKPIAGSVTRPSGSGRRFDPNRGSMERPSFLLPSVPRPSGSGPFFVPDAAAPAPAATRDDRTIPSHYTGREVSIRTTDIDETVKMPWEVDGQAWHTINRRDHDGAPVEWDPNLLIWLVEAVQSWHHFAPTDWADRSRVEITTGKGSPWFCHFLTGFKDLLELHLRVPQGSFPQTELRAALKIPTLDARQDLPIYGQWERVRIRRLKGVAGAWDNVSLSLRDFKDVSKSALRAFLKKAAAAHVRHAVRVLSSPKLAEPWKADGQEWHLSHKGMSKSQRPQWPAALLMTLIGRFKAIERELDVDWRTKTAVLLHVPGERAYRAKIITNMGRGVRLEVRAPKNVFTPTQVERLGEDVEIVRRSEADWIVFWLKSLTDNDSAQLRDVWTRSINAGRMKEAEFASA